MGEKEIDRRLTNIEKSEHMARLEDLDRKRESLLTERKSYSVVKELLAKRNSNPELQAELEGIIKDIDGELKANIQAKSEII